MNTSEISLTDNERIGLFQTLVRSMALDRMMMRVIRAGRMVGFYHEGGIALAPGVAAGFFLAKSDIMWPHYRAHGIAHMLSKGVDVKRYVAEHLGREAGCCKGRSSFHFSFPADHIFGLSGNIGANFPASVGFGFAAKHKGLGQVVMNCSGDGSYGSGRAHESLLMCANWRLPVIFWCEANGMAQHSSMKTLFPGPSISSLAAGYGIPSHIADGQDVFACAEAARLALDHTRHGNGPIFIECKTLRSQEHSVGGVNYEGIKPRDAELMRKWREDRNPEKLAAAKLIDAGLLTAEAIAAIHNEADREADEMEAYCEALPKATPSIEELSAAVYA
jgi:acetoin:2,6-dichlorophenolindophenol oxidoreductase subunit alpha